MFGRDPAERAALLDSMMDDAEDVEQLYLAVNRSTCAIGPCQPRFLLRYLIDEISCMLEGGIIESKYSNDEANAPLDSINASLLHQYWFSPARAGMELWRRARGMPSVE